MGVLFLVVSNWGRKVKSDTLYGQTLGKYKFRIIRWFNNAR